MKNTEEYRLRSRELVVGNELFAGWVSAHGVLQNGGAAHACRGSSPPTPSGATIQISRRQRRRCRRQPAPALTSRRLRTCSASRAPSQTRRTSRPSRHSSSAWPIQLMSSSWLLSSLIAAGVRSYSQTNGATLSHSRSFVVYRSYAACYSIAPARATLCEASALAPRFGLLGWYWHARLTSLASITTGLPVARR